MKQAILTAPTTPETAIREIMMRMIVGAIVMLAAMTGVGGGGIAFATGGPRDGWGGMLPTAMGLALGVWALTILIREMQSADATPPPPPESRQDEQ